MNKNTLDLSDFPGEEVKTVDGIDGKAGEGKLKVAGGDSVPFDLEGLEIMDIDEGGDGGDEELDVLIANSEVLGLGEEVPEHLLEEAGGVDYAGSNDLPPKKEPRTASNSVVVAELETLNPSQRGAVETFDRPLLVLSGAGSGKTRVISHKIATIIDSSLAFPWQILAVTFTNKAAREMSDRITKFVGTLVKDINLGTFHSICAKMLRVHHAEIGFTQDFSILDSQDQKKLMKTVMGECSVSTKVHNPSSIISKISKIKNEGKTPEEYSASSLDGPEFADGVGIGTLYAAYQKRMHSMNMMDFDDLILKAVKLLILKESIRDEYRKKIKYVLIDEYQDINALQFKWIKLLSGDNQNICCVGDDDQSIYGWRGSDVSIILSFAKHFANSKIIRLEQNYRSTSNILAVAHNLIRHNVNRIGKKLWTNSGSGPKVEVLCYPDSRTESKNIATQILDLKNNQGVCFTENSILVRASSQTRSLEEAMMLYDIPYKIIGGLRFYERKEIKDVVAYVKVIFDDYDDIAFERVLQTPKRGIGETSIDKLYTYAKERGLNLITALLKMFYVDRTELERLSILSGKFAKEAKDSVDSGADVASGGRTKDVSSEDFSSESASTTGMLFDIGDPLDGRFKKKSTSRRPTVSEVSSAQILGIIRSQEGASSEAQEEKVRVEKLFSSRTMKLFAQVASDLVRWREAYQERGDISSVILNVLEEVDYSGYLEEEDDSTHQTRMENVNEIVTLMKGFNNISGFLEHVSLFSDQDRTAERVEKVKEVSIMTIHMSKGLEFPYVFCPGWEEGLFPSSRSVEEYGEQGIEEERRLGYVAITRAMKSLKVSYAKMRFMHNNLYPTQESIFVQEILLDSGNLVEFRDLSLRAGSVVGKNFSGPGGGVAGGAKWDYAYSKKGSRGTKKALQEGREFASAQAFLDQIKEDVDSESIRPSSRVVHKSLGRGTVTRRITPKLFEVKFDNLDEVKTIRYDFLRLAPE